MARKPRDYAAEYRRLKERAQAAGKSVYRFRKDRAAHNRKVAARKSRSYRPEALRRVSRRKYQTPQDYYDAVAQVDISLRGGIHNDRDRQKFYRALYHLQVDVTKERTDAQFRQAYPKWNGVK